MIYQPSSVVINDRFSEVSYSGMTANDQFVSPVADVSVFSAIDGIQVDHASGGFGMELAMPALENGKYMSVRLSPTFRARAEITDVGFGNIVYFRFRTQALAADPSFSYLVTINGQQYKMHITDNDDFTFRLPYSNANRLAFNSFRVFGSISNFDLYANTFAANTYTNPVIPGSLYGIAGYIKPTVRIWYK
jgi:hypothetical protein